LFRLYKISDESSQSDSDVKQFRALEKNLLKELEFEKIDLEIENFFPNFKGKRDFF